jgi:hypothetical protein
VARFGVLVVRIAATGSEAVVMISQRVDVRPGELGGQKSLERLKSKQRGAPKR